MYNPVSKWLEDYLSSVFKRAKVFVYDTHATPLNDLISQKGFQEYFETTIWQTYDIRVDVAGFIVREKRLDIAFVECKTLPLSLAHMSQLLGYCRVVNPLLAYLVSTEGVGGTLNSLLLTYNRTDVLEYFWPKGRFPRRIFLAKWNRLANRIDPASILPTGPQALVGTE